MFFVFLLELFQWTFSVVKLLLTAQKHIRVKAKNARMRQRALIGPDSRVSGSDDM